MDLEDVLRDVQTNCGNLFHGRPPVWRLATAAYIVPGWRPSTPSGQVTRDKRSCSITSSKSNFVLRDHAGFKVSIFRNAGSLFSQLRPTWPLGATGVGTLTPKTPMFVRKNMPAAECEGLIA